MLEFLETNCEVHSFCGFAELNSFMKKLKESSKIMSEVNYGKLLQTSSSRFDEHAVE